MLDPGSGDSQLTTAVTVGTGSVMLWHASCDELDLAESRRSGCMGGIAPDGQALVVVHD